jgi:hypothetical protein
MRDFLRTAALAAALLAGSAQAQWLLLRGGGGGYSQPINNGGIAAGKTALNNALCTAISPFYAEIGNASGALWSISSGTTWNATTGMNVDSASKWQYAELVTAVRGGLANLTATDVSALTFSDGYTNMGSVTVGTQCIGPSGLSAITATISNGSALWAATNTYYSNEAVTLGGTVPTPFVAGTTYYVMSTNLTGAQFELSATPAGSGFAAITATASGSVSATAVPNFSCAASPGGTTNTPTFCGAQCGVNVPSQPNTYQVPATVGYFDYDGAHEQVHAINQNPAGVATLAGSALYAAYAQEFATINPTAYPAPYTAYGTFTQPMIAGGIYQTPAHYALFLRTVLGSNALKSILAGGNNAAYYQCAWLSPFVTGTPLSGSCNTTYYSPITSYWRYSLGHWWETDNVLNTNDWSVSSPGAAGFYPFIMPLCAGTLCTSQSQFNTAYASVGSAIWTYYGMIARYATPGTNPTGNGQASAKCGQVVRKAYVTGVQQ